MSSWLRLWTDMPTDPKFRLIARKAGQPVTVVLAVYVHMLTTAAEAEPRGDIVGWDDEVVAIALDLDVEDVVAVREAMQGRVLDGDHLTGWEKRQPKREDGAAERAKEWRERKKAEKSDDCEQRTDRERNRTQANAEERPDQIRSDKEQRDQLSIASSEENSAHAQFSADEQCALTNVTPVSAAELSKAVIRATAGQTNATPSQPVIRHWAAAGIAPTLVAEAVTIARGSKPTGRIPVNYLDPIVRELAAGARHENRPAGRAAGAGRPSAVQRLLDSAAAFERDLDQLEAAAGHGPVVVAHG